MTIQTTDNNIREQAADWYDRLHELNAAEQQQYQRWLMQSPQHAAAMSWLQQQLGEHDEALLIALERVATANHKARQLRRKRARRFCQPGEQNCCKHCGKSCGLYPARAGGRHRRHWP
ncbi:MAG: FecR/PupR family sigma factor regulator [Gammaproteobacteria bacterium]|nr:FecR/PupR family sigma factor regulator [Gammaproteobacteria bacterium]